MDKITKFLEHKEIIVSHKKIVWKVLCEAPFFEDWAKE